jgi:hypothetical protein
MASEGASGVRMNTRSVCPLAMGHTDRLQMRLRVHLDEVPISVNTKVDEIVAKQ